MRPWRRRRPRRCIRRTGNGSGAAEKGGRGARHGRAWAEIRGSEASAEWGGWAGVQCCGGSARGRRPRYVFGRRQVVCKAGVGVVLATRRGAQGQRGGGVQWGARGRAPRVAGGARAPNRLRPSAGPVPLPVAAGSNLQQGGGPQGWLAPARGARGREERGRTEVRRGAGRRGGGGESAQPRARGCRGRVAARAGARAADGLQVLLWWRRNTCKR
ncbi:MAG: hypothetical protein J3K34DRAFT_425173 [Monoraphidium minutum]|nr:MAG: hypothetical protein J3K34DRAFT_425173 [Monoraphidium minutum]